MICPELRTARLRALRDPGPFVPAIKEAGCTLIRQVQDVDDGRAAKAAGADIIVAQGTEAGGHGADRSTPSLVPAVVDAVAPTPVLAAGGTPTDAAWRRHSCSAHTEH